MDHSSRKSALLTLQQNGLKRYHGRNQLSPKLGVYCNERDAEEVEKLLVTYLRSEASKGG